MKAITFSSPLAAHMEDFCAMHRNAGADYESPSRRLRYFDRFLAREQFAGDYPTGEVIDRYLSGLAHLKPTTQASYFCSISQFCNYLVIFEPECPLPHRSRFPRSWESFIPYIFSGDEIRALLAAAGRFTSRDPLRRITLKILIGLLASTGLRIAEALSLNLGDIYCDRLRLLVRNGKFRKERWVPLSPTTCQALEGYFTLRSKTWLAGSSSPLFLNIRKQRLSYFIARTSFRKILVQAGVYSGTGQAPRLHDLRHSFAVSCLRQAYVNGEDPNKVIPNLATFMGHVGVRSTQLYLHTTPELWQQAYKGSLAYFRTHVSPPPKKGDPS